jgi:hypothetical protein
MVSSRGDRILHGVSATELRRTPHGYELLPCPFCGACLPELFTGEDFRYERELPSLSLPVPILSPRAFRYSAARCAECGAQGPRVEGDSLMAAAAWNRRGERGG